MAFVPIEEYTLGEGAHGVVEYNDAGQKRISRFYWENIPPNTTVYVIIWDTSDASYPDPVFNGSFVDSGESPIAGSYRAVTETDPNDGHEFDAIPSNIIVSFSSVTVQG